MPIGSLCSEIQKHGFKSAQLRANQIEALNIPKLVARNVQKLPERLIRKGSSVAEMERA